MPIIRFLKTDSSFWIFMLFKGIPAQRQSELISCDWLKRSLIALSRVLICLTNLNEVSGPQPRTGCVTLCCWGCCDWSFRAWTPSCPWVLGWFFLFGEKINESILLGRWWYSQISFSICRMKWIVKWNPLGIEFFLSFFSSRMHLALWQKIVH